MEELEAGFFQRRSINLTSNVLKELLSSGMTFFLFHVPQAYWKKFSPIEKNNT